MLANQIVHCPNCGGMAERTYFESNSCGSNSPSTSNKVMMETRCRGCDYVMSQCLSSGAVLEFYAPGISMDLSQAQLAHCSL
ncbi:MAG: replication restart DNA helicase PriA [Cyanobacteria bacterium P01_F01_bin.53]